MSHIKKAGLVRRAKPDDAASVVDVHYRTWLAAFLPMEDDLTEEIIKKRFHFSETTGLQEHTELARNKIEVPDANTQMFVYEAEDDHRIDGFIVAGKSGDGRKEIRALYVDPKAQGKGIGQQLMGAALQYLQQTLT